MARQVDRVSRTEEATNVNVVIRLRPPLKTDDENWRRDTTDNHRTDQSIVRGVNNTTVELWNYRNDKETLSYQFDAFLDETVSQTKLFETVIKPFCEHCLNGQNGSVFAYGPTGGGKTHTMVGPMDDPGIIPHSVYEIFKSIENFSQEWEFTVQFSYLEIYREKLCDLLDPKQNDMKIHQDRDKNIFIRKLTEQEVTSYYEFESYFNFANLNRQTAVTKLNERSSRSHAVLLLKVERKQTCPPFRKLTGKMYLIDLAGSEDNRKTGNVGLRLKESGAINTSLFALNHVIDAIRTKSSYVPYRDSKLTRLLQDSLGGAAHACMIANIAPEYKFYTDTHQTLNFASKSRDIVNRPFTRETLVNGKRKPLNELSNVDVPAKSRKLVSSKRISDKNNSHDDETQKIKQTQNKIMNDISNLKSQIANITTMKKTKVTLPHKCTSTVTPTSATEPLCRDTSLTDKKKKHCPISASYTFTEIKLGKVEFNLNNVKKDELFADMVSFLNSADELTLKKTLYGVAEKRAHAIVSWRQAVGTFHTIDDLMEIPGFSRKFILSITQHYFVGNSSKENVES